MAQHPPTKSASIPVIPAVAIFTVWICALALCVRAEAATTVTRADGGPVRTELGFDIVLNQDSSLRREWVAVHDDSLPVDLIETPGVTTAYRGRAGYKYNASYSIMVHEPLAAIEVRFITFDVWGNRTRSLAASDIRDFTPGRYELDAVWNLFSENEAAEHYASVAYVAVVRTMTGKIHYADTAAVIEVAQQYMSDFTDDLLDEAPPGSNGGN